ncbi:unnamed protein product [Arctia plantaginis]|uniref:Uncharacterized protein n=1 Tax=Arctia plantaginis TaxID=874455 RepID=A0A8S0Z750_ARCPL|nr:unnamed protein product [Arctia plantaginis]
MLSTLKHDDDTYQCQTFAFKSSIWTMPEACFFGEKKLMLLIMADQPYQERINLNTFFLHPPNLHVYQHWAKSSMTAQVTCFATSYIVA